MTRKKHVSLSDQGNLALSPSLSLSLYIYIFEALSTKLLA